MTQESLSNLGMYLLAGLLLACGDGIIEQPTAMGPFTEMHSDKVTYDCAQTVNCSLRRGGSVSAGDSLGVCEGMSGAILEGDANLQSTFLTNFSRCRAFSECSYVDCATSGAHGYGETQRPSITYDCQQKLTCNTSQGTFKGDANQAVSSCVSESIGLLDTFAPERRRLYELTYTQCSSMTSCEFVGCFIY